MKEVSIISKVVSRGKAEALPSASASMPNWAELAKYVTIDGDETINGLKNFKKGLQIDGLGISKLQDDVVYLDAHLVVRGGITMFGTGEDVDVPTIMDALSVDGVNLQVVNGVLTFVGEATGGVADSVRWENVIGRPTLLSSFTDDVVAGKYLPITGNAATATKLQTARTIWGKSFDGTGNISGDLYLSKGRIFGNGDIDVLNSNGEWVILGNGCCAKQWNTYVDGYNIYFRSGASTPNMILNRDGNVGIGTTNPEYKIDVVGDIRSTTNVRTPVATIDGIPIYKSQDDVLYIDGNLAVRGGITMYADNTISPSTIMDAITTDGVNLKVIDGVLTFVGQTGGGVADAVAWSNVTDKPSWIGASKPSYTWNEISGRPTLLSSFTDDVVAGKYLPITGNAATATKLQTARTIWGQSFDGTGNVDSILTINVRTDKEAIVINNNDNDAAYMQFRRSGTVKGNVGWTNGNGTHLYNATSLKTLELTNDGKLKYGESTAGDEVWHAGNSNNSTVDWNVNSLIAWCGGTNRQLVISKKSYTWAGSADIFPLIGLTTSYDNNVYTMIAMPHIPFLKKGARGYNGDNFGAIIRFEGDASSTAKVWDIGCVSTSVNNFFVQCDGKNIVSFGNNGLTAIYTPNQWLSNSMLVLGRADASVMTTNYGQIGITNGNIHIDAYKGYGVYLNYYQNATGVIIDKDSNLLVSGGITMYSDQRKKTILNHVELSLQQVAEAPLIEHYYNSDSNKTTHVGSIAQYWAGMNDWFCKLDNEGYYTMEIQNAALASAISIARELQRYESKTDKKISLLKKRIGELEEEIEKLKMA